MKTFLMVVAMMFVSGCVDESPKDYDDPDGGDSDSDSDADSGTDADTDTDSDTDAGYDTDCDEGCTQPPDDVCDEEGNLMEYSGASSCVDDVCEYEYDLVTCGYDCVEVDGDDYCMDDACDGVVCDDHPDDECDTTNLLIVYEEAEGNCDLDTGECYYSWSWENCPNECIVVSGADDYCS